jgi:hypothetical protein
MNVPENRVEEEICYFGLAEWWLSTFTEAERNYIESFYHPFSFKVSLGDSEFGEMPKLDVSLSYSYGGGTEKDERPLTQGQYSGYSGL